MKTLIMERLAAGKFSLTERRLLFIIILNASAFKIWDAEWIFPSGVRCSASRSARDMMISEKPGDPAENPWVWWRLFIFWSRMEVGELTRPDFPFDCSAVGDY